VGTKLGGGLRFRSWVGEYEDLEFALGLRFVFSIQARSAETGSGERLTLPGELLYCAVR
jgi:hypothetical protein